MSTENQRFSIVSGESLIEMEHAFFDKKMVLPFHVQIVSDSEPDERDISIVLRSLEWEDGSRENWNFTGYLAMKGPQLPYRMSAQKIKGYYSTKTRKGWIEYISW